MQGFETPHEAIKAMNDGVTNGQYKLCAHLGYTLSGSPFEVIRFYYPVCAKDCFVGSDPWHHEMKCPTDCHLYVDREVAMGVARELQKLEERTERRKRVWAGVRTVIAAPVKYFQSLPPLVQSLLIILLIVWKLPSLKTTIIEILRAISGK
jgi:hypothetical protein